MTDLDLIHLYYAATHVGACFVDCCVFLSEKDSQLIRFLYFKSFLNTFLKIPFLTTVSPFLAMCAFLSLSLLFTDGQAF